MAKAKVAEAVVVHDPTESVIIALNRIASALERLAGPGGTLNPPGKEPIPAYVPSSVRDGPVGTLEEETAKLHAATAKARAEKKPEPTPEPEPADPLAGLLGEEAEPAGPTATFAEARKALMDAAKDPPSGIGPDGVLKLLKTKFGVEKLSSIPNDDTVTLGKFVAAVTAAVAGKR